MPAQQFHKHIPRTGFTGISPEVHKIFDAATSSENPESRCLICVRSNEYHIYYRGGKILGVKPHRLFFDANYLKRTDGTMRTFSYVKDGKIDYQSIAGNPHAFFAEAREVMDQWFAEHRKQEREDQHIIACANPTRVIDIEFAVSLNANYYNLPYFEANGRYRRLPNPRFDIIAIDNDGQLYVFELKTGLQALGNVQKHIDDFNATIGSAAIGDDPALHEPRHLTFLKEMQLMVDVINSQHLRGNAMLPRVDTGKKPIFKFLFTAKDAPPASQATEFQAKVGNNCICLTPDFKLPL